MSLTITTCKHSITEIEGELVGRGTIARLIDYQPKGGNYGSIRLWKPPKQVVKQEVPGKQPTISPEELEAQQARASKRTEIDALIAAKEGGTGAAPPLPRSEVIKLTREELAKRAERRKQLMDIATKSRALRQQESHNPKSLDTFLERYLVGEARGSFEGVPSYGSIGAIPFSLTPREKSVSKVAPARNTKELVELLQRRLGNWTSDKLSSWVKESMDRLADDPFVQRLRIEFDKEVEKAPRLTDTSTPELAIKWLINYGRLSGIFAKVQRITNPDIV